MHRSPRRFWEEFDYLLADVQQTARKNFQLLKRDTSHRFLRFKKVGRFWSARVGIYYRALSVQDGSDFIWVWMGARDEYDRML